MGVEQVAIKLCAEYYANHVKPESAIREKGVAAAFFWYWQIGEIAYWPVPPFSLGKPLWVPRQWDCSAFATACHYAGGRLERPWLRTWAIRGR